MAAISVLHWLIDICLGAGLLWLAWFALFSRDLFRAIVLFVTFGLLLALIWLRLGAVDVALAEAAIGAGLTGALLITALSRLRMRENRPPGRRKKMLDTDAGDSHEQAETEGEDD